MKKTYTTIIVILIGLILVGAVYYFLNKEKPVACQMDAKECPDGSFVGRVPPNCEFALCPGEEAGILITSPEKEEEIFSPWRIMGQAKGPWYFEAQFKAELYDDNQNLLGTAILTSIGDWMTEDFVPFEGELIFTKPTTPSGVLRFLSDNPSGLPQNQKVFEMKVQFAETTPTQKILLYYYNPEKDKDKQGNVKCSRDGLVAIEREVSVNETSIIGVINLLLRGKENLTAEDKAQGITTEYPLEGFSLEEAVLKADGTLVLTFSDPFNKTSGGSCRAGILWFQIEETAKQFEDVKKVEFLPEELFQP
ncbi:MAG: Gmad2 immunoglobulin-like domain-containing protein [Candidatus Pacebacteria bacterium]|nr:Gmad2 immunoglobulin-like domain-containing protein [Candidatus Paceibacterota bacterium]